MEIERKFLIDQLPKHLDLVDKKIIEQGYISTAPVIRIRRSNDDYILTIKGKGLIKREEFELLIEKDEYNKLKEKIEHNLIKKTRYIYKDENYTYEVDEFDGHLKGLLLAEIEFESKTASDKFIPEVWLGKEVSNDPSYQNSNLCQLKKGKI